MLGHSFLIMHVPLNSHSRSIRQILLVGCRTLLGLYKPYISQSIES